MRVPREYLFMKLKISFIRPFLKKTSLWNFNFHEQLFPRNIPENKFIISSACTFFYFKKILVTTV